MGWRITKAKVIRALREGTYLYDARNDISEKNLLVTLEVSPDDIRRIIEKCNGKDCESSPHHGDSSIEVHIIRRSGWYIKFYFVDPDTVFISVHR